MCLHGNNLSLRFYSVRVGWAFAFSLFCPLGDVVKQALAGGQKTANNSHHLAYLRLQHLFLSI